MRDIPRLYVSSCSNSVQLVPLHPIIISILFHHYKELKECISEVEQIEAGVSNKQRRLMTVKEEEVPTTLDSYLISNKSLKGNNNSCNVDTVLRFMFLLLSNECLNTLYSCLALR